jgi:hypothetical protein
MTGMRRTLFFASVFGLMLAPSLSAQQSLPDNFAGWSASGPAIRLGPEAAGKQPTEAAAVLTEAGLVGAARRGYSQGSRTLTLTLYQLRDPSGALAAFTYLRAPGMIPSDLEIYAALARDRAIFLSGSAVVDVTGLTGATISDLRELAAAFRRSADKTPLPPIRNYLPAAGRIAGSEKYILGPEGFRAAAADLSRPELAPLAEKIGFDSGAEAMLARYRIGRAETGLFLLEYPTPQSAGLHQKHIEAALAPGAQPSGLPIRRKGSLLSLVLPGASPATAQALLDGVRYETNITWNEPTHALTDPPWPVVVVNTIIGTGVFLGAAIVFGIAFGGVRLITKLILPGKVFDRRDQMQILQLGLSAKPIDSNDFYASWNPRG